MTSLHLFVFTVCVALNSCGDVGNNQEEITKILFIKSKLADCESLMPQKCMLIRENPEEEWAFFYDAITGFDYEEGFHYKIQVRISEIENPPADGSSLAYVLTKVISKEKEDLSGESKVIIQSHPNRVIYEASTRGFFERIEITPDSIKKTNNRGKTNYAFKDCKKEDWNTITSMIQPINLEEMEALEAPSGKRLYDGAAHATVVIIEGDIKYRSVTFDHKNPPATLKPLVNQILSLAESIE